MMTIREATAEDAALISRINTSSWRGAYRSLLPEDYLRRLPEDAWTSSVRSWLGSGQLSALIALQDGEAVGCVIFGRCREESYAQWGEIVSLCVLPSSLRQGVGSTLLLEALTQLKADGFDRCCLWALQGSFFADAFYRHHGFTTTDERYAYRLGGQDVADLRYIRS